MAVEFAKMRIAKIRNDLSYSNKNLKNILGINNKEDSQASISDLQNWQIR